MLPKNAVYQNHLLPHEAQESRSSEVPPATGLCAFCFLLVYGGI